ncbi:MAG: DsrE/DsrF/DrsH-like family protein [Deltaproteobacteria bacterium]|jgi:peroxiredoxin family protein|nr:DsrE/DsrF/DrsH-like family protein [Deltaproteobacteria bacterium]MBW2530677.1 DsrE/DsrF/DrsH-like family protein [Deltaproteobacteria bacterium]
MTATAPKLEAVSTVEDIPVVEPAPLKKVAIICSKGSLDMAYPGLILANAARMSGIEATLFFTFWGLDVVTAKKVDKLNVSTVGNPSMGMPTFLGAIPGMQWFATKMMKSQIDKLDIPPVREMIETLDDAGAELYACRLASDMMGLKDEDYLPQVKGIITAMDFFDKAQGASIIFI